ncbi:MAG TPA: protein-disulfide reductase DsbD domain-containing protein, partial [Pyrinomonadaceae bacterium]|nr:protein-disulfide reductase DsbD domain-containing protein [Pyrinomonadaceae bacterium]
MLYRTINTLAFVSMLVVFAACAGNSDVTTNVSLSGSPVASQASAKPPADIVRASASEVELGAGGAGEATVQITIADGYHVNANPATHSFLIPTKLDVTAENGIMTGEPVYPAPLTKKFAFDEKPLAVYEGVTTIKLPVTASAATPKGARTL